MLKITGALAGETWNCNDDGCPIEILAPFVCYLALVIGDEQSTLVLVEMFADWLVLTLTG
jgi:hypothetical protein